MLRLLEFLVRHLQARSVCMGILVGIALAALLGSAIQKGRWGWGMVKRPLLVQDDVQEMYSKSWRDHRSGCKGCRSALFLGILFIGLLVVVVYSLWYYMPW